MSSQFRRKNNPFSTNSRGSGPPTPRLPRVNEPYGAVVDQFNAQTLLVEQNAPKIEQVKYIASYNWLNENTPTILIPGSPPIWMPLAEDIKLKPDSGDVYRDVNAAHYASYPMEPAVRSVLALNKESDLPSVDVFGCGSTIGNLLGYARPQTNPMPFRFDVVVIGDTVFLIRRGESPTEKIVGHTGWGHSFPEMYTSWDSDVRGSCSHQRIISYDFGGMRFFVRSETDGYLRAEGKGPRSSFKATEETSIDSILGSLDVGVRQPQKTASLEIRKQGTMIPQDRIFDIKTRAIYKTYNMEDILPRLWVNQTPNFLLAYHDKGLFNRPVVKPIKSDILKWERDNSSHLARFHAMVKRIVDVVRDSDDNQFEVSWDGQGPLKITKQVMDRGEALPQDLSTLWEKL